MSRNKIKPKYLFYNLKIKVIRLKYIYIKVNEGVIKDISSFDLPYNCPCNEIDDLKCLKELYFEDENCKLSYNSALVESEGYCKKTRLRLTILICIV